VRDASGNVMSVYRYGDNTLNSGQMTLAETHLYGSSRLGLGTPKTNVQTLPAPAVSLLPGLGVGVTASFTRGQKTYELSNHLGNVLVTVSDKKIGVDMTGDGPVNYYTADVTSASSSTPLVIICIHSRFLSLNARGTLT
jgi:hypothetical protein